MKTNSQEPKNTSSATRAPSITNPRTTARGRCWYANNHYGAEGTLFIDNDTDHHIYIYGMRDLRVWNPQTKSWIDLPDKFYVTQDDPELARSEFYARWKIYIQKRFRTNYIRIEIKATEVNN